MYLIGRLVLADTTFTCQHSLSVQVKTGTSWTHSTGSSAPLASPLDHQTRNEIRNATLPNSSKPWSGDHVCNYQVRNSLKKEFTWKYYQSTADCCNPCAYKNYITVSQIRHFFMQFCSWAFEVIKRLKNTSLCCVVIICLTGRRNIKRKKKDWKKYWCSGDGSQWKGSIRFISRLNRVY